MAKGSVRKKGKKWYYRFYVEDASGNRVQSWLKSIGNGDKDSAYIMYPFADKLFYFQSPNTSRLIHKAVFPNPVAYNLKPPAIDV